MTNQPYPQQPYQPQPVKKKHTVRNVLLIILALGILCIGGCFAILGAAVNEAGKAMDDETKNDTPTKVTEGGAFTHDGFKVAAGWKVKREQFGGVSLSGVKVTNASKDNQRSALLTFTFYKGTENLAEVECSSNELQAGESSGMQCFSTAEKFPSGYDTIKVADAF